MYLLWQTTLGLRNGFSFVDKLFGHFKYWRVFRISRSRQKHAAEKFPALFDQQSFRVKERITKLSESCTEWTYSRSDPVLTRLREKIAVKRANLIGHLFVID
jgi:hypothetical protein